MGIEPYLVGSTVIGILAQRLVRRLCEHCKTPIKPTDIDTLADCLGMSAFTIRDVWSKYLKPNLKKKVKK